MTAHAKLGPSNHRWPNCPGSIREEASYPDVAGEAAIDGTGSHLLLELCLKEGRDAASFIGLTIGEGDEEKPLGWFVQEDRATRVQMCLDYVEHRVGQLKDRFPESEITVEAESRSYPGRQVQPMVDDWWGTCDITISVKVKGLLVYLEVVDYKDGRGYVNVEDNSQLWSYLIGKAYSPRQSNMLSRMVIVQPKTNPPVRYTEDVTTVEIGDELNRLAAAARATEDPEAPVIAGSWCQWCKANPKNGGHCDAPLKKETGAMSSGLIATSTGGLEATISAVIANVAEAPAELLGQLLDADKAFNDALKVVKEEAVRRLKMGHQVPGYYLGEGPSRRAWADEETVKKAMRSAKLKQDEYAPRTQLSVAQIEKLVGSAVFKKSVEQAVVTVAGNPTLKKGTSNRPETQDVKAMFAETATPTKDVKALFAETTAAPAAPARSFI